MYSSTSPGEAAAPAEPPCQQKSFAQSGSDCELREAAAFADSTFPHHLR
jgi:hypothetical protein